MARTSNFFSLIFSLVLLSYVVIGVVADHVHEENEVIRQIIGIVREWQTQHVYSENRPMPFVTASYAQSLDGQMALLKEEGVVMDLDVGNDDADGQQQHYATSSNYPLSGSASRRMTHALRSIHDGILIGGNTLSVDNPRLSNRLWPTTKIVSDEADEVNHNPNAHYKQPIPIILDTHLRRVKTLGATCQCFRNLERGKKLIICCSQEAADSIAENASVGRALILPCKCNSNNRLDLADVLHRLASICGIRAIMVEGGPSVLSSLLDGTQDQDLVHAICITIAPKLLLSHCAVDKGAPCLSPVCNKAPIDLAIEECLPSFIPLGSDCIFLGRWQKTFR